MAEPIRIWLEIAHHAAFRVGGWAFVRDDGGAASGKAGGERRIDAERAALGGLIAALDAAPAGRPVELRTASALIAGVPDRLAAAQRGDDPPSDNLDLWARAATVLGRGEVRISRLTASPGTPSAFAAAWAELARDRAKDKGPFTAAIPKANLAKAGIGSAG